MHPQTHLACRPPLKSPPCTLPMPRLPQPPSTLLPAARFAHITVPIPRSHPPGPCRPADPAVRDGSPDGGLGQVYSAAGAGSHHAGALRKSGAEREWRGEAGTWGLAMPVAPSPAGGEQDQPGCSSRQCKAAQRCVAWRQLEEQAPWQLAAGRTGALAGCRRFWGEDCHMPSPFPENFLVQELIYCAVRGLPPSRA